MHLIRDSLGIGFVALAIAGCSEDAPTPSPADADPVLVASTCGDVGRLQATLSGALNTELDWQDSELRCESMGRPDSRGVRLRLSGAVGSERLAVIIAMPDLDAGETGTEFDSVVTITVDGSGRFFSTPNLGACWTDIATNRPLDDSSGIHAVAGTLTCVGPLGEFNGEAYVDIRDLTFSGIADWSSE